MRVRLLQALLLAALAAAVPGRAAEPAVGPAPESLRLSNGADLWTIPHSALQRFVDDGVFTDQRLLWLVQRSGWPEADLRAALAKPYAVQLAPLARFLYSPAGVAFLQEQTRRYRPLAGRRDLRVEGLRAALLRDAEDGSLSALGIVRALPTAFVFEQGGPGSLRCSALPCDTPAQCRSPLTWYVFLPACLQAATASA